MQQYNYYFSNDSVPFDTITTTHEYKENHYPIVVTQPDPSLKEPKYDWAKGAWIENAAESQGEKIHALQEEVKKFQSVIAQLTSIAQTQKMLATLVATKKGENTSDVNRRAL